MTDSGEEALRRLRAQRAEAAKVLALPLPSLETIHKLLAHGDSAERIGNEHEAEAFWIKARRLVLKRRDGLAAQEKARITYFATGRKIGRLTRRARLKRRPRRRGSPGPFRLF